MTDKNNKFYTDGKRNTLFNNSFNLIAWGRSTNVRKG